jgi:hypothetical protein
MVGFAVCGGHPEMQGYPAGRALQGRGLDLPGKRPLQFCPVLPFPFPATSLPQYPVPLFFHPDGGVSVQYPPQGRTTIRPHRSGNHQCHPAGPPAAALLVFSFSRWPVILAGLAILSLLPFLLFRGKELPVSFTRSFWLAMLVFAFVNFLLYPAILQYQAGTQAGRWIGRTRDRSFAGPAFPPPPCISPAGSPGQLFH